MARPPKARVESRKGEAKANEDRTSGNSRAK
jgi:hypothetical protein